jgi:hypothetical protein
MTSVKVVLQDEPLGVLNGTSPDWVCSDHSILLAEKITRDHLANEHDVRRRVSDPWQIHGWVEPGAFTLTLDTPNLNVVLWPLLAGICQIKM